MKEFERMRGSDGVRKREKREVFIEREKKSYEECEETMEMKRMKKKKNQLVTIWKNEKVGTHLMAKLHVV